MRQLNEILRPDMTCEEGWICPEHITPGWIDLCLEQLGEIYYDNPARFTIYKMKLQSIVIHAVAHNTLDDPMLICMMMTEIEELWGVS